MGAKRHRGRKNVIQTGEGVVLSQVSESKPGAPLFVLLDDFSYRRDPFGAIREARDARDTVVPFPSVIGVECLPVRSPPCGDLDFFELAHRDFQ